MNKFLLGLSTGLLLGILCAPAKGSETRESIAHRGRDLKNKFNDLVDSVINRFDSMKEEMDEMIIESTQPVRSFKNEMV
ncbi:MAG TPA: YtxH domain-containing protein [Chitinophagaceae bacterium]|nr:YtxH domain-containing protein [Chitinophagaceae bacterium]HUM67209.1 YtxH domain-containing protein [Chitinophagaceae bacterium]